MMIKMLFAYSKELYLFARGKLIADVALAVGLGLLEGVGVVMLLPMLAYAGVTPSSQPGAAADFINSVGSALNLPLLLVIYTGIIAGQSWLQRYEAILNTTIQETFDSYLGTSVYRSLAFARWSFFLTVKRADVAHIVTTELTRVSMGTYYFLQLIAIGVVAVIQIGIAFAMAPYLTLLVLGSGLLLFCCLHVSVREARRMGMNISDFSRDLFCEITEHLNGIKEVKSYGAEPLQVRLFEARRAKVEQISIDFVRSQSKTDMLYKIGAAVFISLFYYTAIKVFQLDAQVFLLVLVIFARLWPKFSAFQSGLQVVVMMLPAFQAITQLRARCLAEGEKAVEGLAYSRMTLRKGIKFSGVSFRYDAASERRAVKQASFVIRAGSTTAVVGVSGAGKSTLADLLIGLLSPEKGEIWIDDTRLGSNNVYLWRQNIGYVPQEAFLFHATIRENLVWACPDAAESDIREALKLDFVQSLPHKLDTVVGDRGIRLSGGERQRIVLARALLRKPSLLILDEATSALDTENEQRIQRAVEGLKGKMTIFIIAHRLSTIKNADSILVMDQGRIVEHDSYQACSADGNRVIS